MKKILLIFLLMFPFIVLAKEEVAFSKCVDGDTFKVIINNEEKTVRMLAVDTPETVDPNEKVEYYGKESSEYTCTLLKTAEKIELEYDIKSDRTDKYNRILAWVFVDDYLLQDKLVINGYAEVAYIYDEYKYVDILREHETQAKLEKIGIWNEEKSNSNNIVIVIGIMLLGFIYTYVKKRLKKKFRGSKIRLDLFKE